MLYVSGFVIAFFLSAILLAKTKKAAADYILLAWLLVLGIHLLAYYALLTGKLQEYPLITGLTMPLPLVHGPFLYLYTFQQTSARRFDSRLLLHFLPVVATYLLFMDFYLMTPGQQAEVFRQEGRGFEWQMTIKIYAIYASGIIYVFLSLWQLLKFRSKLEDRFSNTDKINFNWLLYLICWIMVIWIFVLFVHRDDLIYAAASLFVLWLGYFGIRQVQVFTRPTVSVEQAPMINVRLPEVENDQGSIPDPVPVIKYLKSSLSDEEAAAIHAKLRHYLSEHRPYRDSDLTLDDLAKSLSVHPNTLSQVINSQEKKTFYDLINEKRVNAFIETIRKPGSQQFTLLALAYECGFNSKASFNRNFKKYTGQTPSEYLKLTGMHEEEKVA